MPPNQDPTQVTLNPENSQTQYNPPTPPQPPVPTVSPQQQSTQATPLQQPYPVSPQLAVQSPKKKSMKKRVIIGIVVLLVLWFVIGAITGGSVTVQKSDGTVKTTAKPTAVTSIPTLDLDGTVNTDCYTYVAPHSYSLQSDSKTCYTGVSIGTSSEALITVTPYTNALSNDAALAQLQQQLTADGHTIVKNSPITISGIEGVRVDYIQKNRIKMAYIYLASPKAYTHNGKEYKSFSIIAPTGSLQYDTNLATVIEKFSFK